MLAKNRTIKADLDILLPYTDWIFQEPSFGVIMFSSNEPKRGGNK